MASSSHASHTDHHHHVVPTFTYVKTFIALFILMVITIAAAKVNLPGVLFLSGTVVNQLIALGIATIKAALVIWVFMGVRWGTTLTKIWAAAGFVWFILIFLILADYTTRSYEQAQSFEPGVKESALPRAPIKSFQEENPNRNNVRIRQ